LHFSPYFVNVFIARPLRPTRLDVGLALARFSLIDSIDWYLICILVEFDLA